MKRVIIPFFLMFSATLQAEVSAKREGEKIRVEIDGALFTEYRTDRRLACMFPLLAVDGSHLTRRYPFEKDIEGEPKDHPHHVGFWVAHGNVNGNDFWHDANTRIETKSVSEVVSVGPNSVRFTADLEWLGKEKTRIFSEKRSYVITSDGPTRLIDMTCKFEATDGDVVFGDTKEGAFAIRVAPSMQMTGAGGKGKITNSNGVTGKDAWGRRAIWVASHGPNPAGNETVIALMDHPSNLNHPTWWHARDYGLFAANPFGTSSFIDKDPKLAKGFTLKNGETLTQRYRFVIHSGDLPSADLKSRWEAFATSN